jgi:kynureninase
LMEAGDFPTNGYIAQGLSGRATIRFVARDAIADAISPDTIALCLSHAHYKTGQLHDMAALTKQAQAAGALAIWDVCHSAGALPVALNTCGVDFAVGCTYKYLNGGPGAPGFVFAASRHLAAAAQPVQGWWGHDDPFAFTQDFQPKSGIRRFLTGTPPIVSMAMIEAGIAVHEQADMAAIRAKSLALGDLMIALVEERLDGFTLATPRDGALRGSQVSFAHPHAYPIMQALIAAGVIGDFRAPDLLRFGFAPLYVRYVDVWDAVEILVGIMVRGAWQDPQFAARNAVT